MPAVNRLTEAQIRSWVKSPREGMPATKLADGGGLYLVRLPSGNVTWQSRYRLGGVEKTLSIGPHHEIGLSRARDEHRCARDMLRAGKDPMKVREAARAEKIASSGQTVTQVMSAWLEKERAEWSSDHYHRSKMLLEKSFLPGLARLAVADVTPAMISATIGKIQRESGRDTAAKVLRQVRGIFRYAAALGLRADNPADAAIEILKAAPPVQHRIAVTTEEGAREVLAALAAMPLSPAVALCHKLLAHTAVRIGNAVAARWEHFDLDAGFWVIPRGEMKMRDRTHDHRVPLTAAIVAELRRYAEGGRHASGYIFPRSGTHGRGHRAKAPHMSRETVEKAIRINSALAKRHSCHGWRATFSTLAKDAGFENEVVDLALDHIHDTEVARAYDRGERLEKRIKLMQWWGETLAAR